MSKQAGEILKKHGMRVTAIRQDVVRLFASLDHAVTHQEVEQSLPEADRVTLYRTLGSFEEKGIIHQILDDGPAKKFALCGTRCSEENHHDEHVHFKCTSCGETRCLPEVVLQPVKLPTGYKASGIDLLVQGTCSNC